MISLETLGYSTIIALHSRRAFTPLTLIYGENARGKTTLAAILRSLATNNPDLVIERHRLGAQHPPHIVFSHPGGQAIFQNGAWSQSLPDIAIFDDAFVSANVCSGIELQSAHRQHLHELILGAQGVALNAALKGHITRIEEHNAALRELAEAIPSRALGPYKVDAFCNLDEDPDIDQKIQDAERRLAAAKSADAIRQRPSFQAIGLPDFDIDELNSCSRKNPRRSGGSRSRTGTRPYRPSWGMAVKPGLRTAWHELPQRPKAKKVRCVLSVLKTYQVPIS